MSCDRRRHHQQLADRERVLTIRKEGRCHCWKFSTGTEKGKRCNTLLTVSFTAYLPATEVRTCRRSDGTRASPLQAPRAELLLPQIVPSVSRTYGLLYHCCCCPSFFQLLRFGPLLSLNNRSCFPGSLACSESLRLSIRSTRCIRHTSSCPPTQGAPCACPFS